MKYVYFTATGKNEVEVDERYYDLLLSLDREEFNSDRKHKRRHPVSLNNADYAGDWMTDGTDVLDDLVRTEECDLLHRAIKALPSSQRELIRAIAAGISPADYARRKGTSKAAVSQQIERARKNLQKSFR